VIYLQGFIYTPAASLFLKRAEDVKVKTLYVSKAVGADRLLLALLTLVVYADRVREQKAKLPRGEVPITPTGATAPELLSPRSHHSPQLAAGAQSSTEQEGLQQQQQVLGQPRALFVGDGADPGRLSSASPPAGGAGSSGSEGIVSVSSQSNQGCVTLPDQTTVTLHGFDTLCVSSVCVGSGRYGSVLQVWHSVIASCCSHDG
jgi:hypothetical protein